MDVLESKCRKSIITFNKSDIPIYTVNEQFLFRSVDLARIIKEERLTGKTKPVAIIQYATIYPGVDESKLFYNLKDSDIMPMIAFVWSWGGPWAYIYNVQYPSWSESGSVPYHRVKQFAGYNFSNINCFMSRE